MSVRVRFAPSPTGNLHVGNVRTALFNWLFARRQGGSFVLRVEDTDAERSQKVYETQLLEDLRWLGLEWNEGVEVGGKYGPYHQSERLEIYGEIAGKLLEEAQAYYCFCTAEELEERRQRLKQEGKDFLYSGKCRDIPLEQAKRRVASGEPATVRLKVRDGTVGFEDLVFGPLKADASSIGDFVLLRSDGSAQYNLACVIDDYRMRIDHVIRGEGHISNTYRQLLIYESLELPQPRFAHLSTILGPDGSKLSKRHGATSVDQFRKAGYLPEGIVNYLSFLGWTPPEGVGEILNLEEITAHFQLESLSRSPATFDQQKLNWVNRGHLKEKSIDELARLSRPWLVGAGLVPESPSAEIVTWVSSLIKLAQNYIDKLEDLQKAVEPVFSFSPAEGLADDRVADILSAEGSADVIRVFAELIADTEGPIGFEEYKSAVLATKERTGQKGKGLFQPIRIAVTARASGPELEHLIPVLEEGCLLELPKPVVGVKTRVKSVSQQLGA